MPLPDLLQRTSHQFVLWRPGRTAPAPQLVIGQVKWDRGYPAIGGLRKVDLQQDPGLSDLWLINLADVGLVDGQKYWYWFAVNDTRPGLQGLDRVWCTDPLAGSVDWELLAPSLPAPYTQADRNPAAVVRVTDDAIVSVDPEGSPADWREERSPELFAANNKAVFYELPTRWSSTGDLGEEMIGTGTFQDVLALVDLQTSSPRFPSSATRQGYSYLQDLGVNVLELLPIADSPQVLEWAYGTAHYLAPSFNLGFTRPPTSCALAELATLVVACHSAASPIRIAYDAVMAFSLGEPYTWANYLDFHVEAGSGDPEEDNRNAYGGSLFKYNYETTGYDPVSGARSDRLYPARQYQLVHIARWLLDWHIDAIRIDSVANIAQPDFLQQFSPYARNLFRERWALQTGRPADRETDARFLVVAEDLDKAPIGLVTSGAADAVWNEWFKQALRQAIIGHSASDTPSFELTVCSLIDCRYLGFTDLSQVVNYVTSHDTSGWQNERLYNFLINNGVWDTSPRIKLAFACLMTAVGIPLILAGEEFADVQVSPITDENKQITPVNFSRLDQDAWRADLFRCIARLVKLRTTTPSLGVNDTTFLHVDFNEGKRVMAWARGIVGSPQVIVVANFSDWSTSGGAEGNYEVSNWPGGENWYEVVSDRSAPRAGSEGLQPWCAYVYVQRV